jgi:hypothetical protein
MTLASAFSAGMAVTMLVLAAMAGALVVIVAVLIPVLLVWVGIQLFLSSTGK